jgi:hypothetical protein
MPKNTITKRIKTKCEITDSELLNALKNSMGPIFEHFEEEIAKSGGAVLLIEVRAQAGKVNLKYGFTDIQSGNSVFSPTNK